MGWKSRVFTAILTILLSANLGLADEDDAASASPEIKFRTVFHGAPSINRRMDYAEHVIHSQQQLKELGLAASLAGNAIDFDKESLIVVVSSYTDKLATLTIKSISQRSNHTLIQFEESDREKRLVDASAAYWTQLHAVTIKKLEGHFSFQPTVEPATGPQALSIVENGDSKLAKREWVIRSQEELAASGIKLKTALKPDFFENRMLLGVFLGVKPTYGYRVKIALANRVKVNGAYQLKVSVRVGVPGYQSTGVPTEPEIPNASNNGLGVGAAPYDIVSMRKLSDTVLFNYERPQSPLGKVLLQPISRTEVETSEEIRQQEIGSIQEWYDFARRLKKPPDLPKIDWSKQRLLASTSELLTARRELRSGDMGPSLVVKVKREDNIGPGTVLLHLVAVDRSVLPERTYYDESPGSVEEPEAPVGELVFQNLSRATIVGTETRALSFDQKTKSLVLRHTPNSVNKTERQITGTATEAEIKTLSEALKVSDFKDLGDFVELLEPQGSESTYILEVDMKANVYGISGATGFYRQAGDLKDLTPRLKPLIDVLDAWEKRLEKEGEWKDLVDPVVSLTRETERSELIEGSFKKVLSRLELHVDKKSATLKHGAQTRKAPLTDLETSELQRLIAAAKLPELPRKFADDEGLGGQRFALNTKHEKWQKHGITGIVGQYQDAEGKDFKDQFSPLQRFLDKLEARLKALPSDAETPTSEPGSGSGGSATESESTETRSRGITEALRNAENP